MRRENAAHRHLELAHHRRRDFVNLHAAERGKRLLQIAALIHGGGGDDATLVGERLHALQFAGGQRHLGYYGTLRYKPHRLVITGHLQIAAPRELPL